MSAMGLVGLCSTRPFAFYISYENLAVSDEPKPIFGNPSVVVEGPKPIEFKATRTPPVATQPAPVRIEPKGLEFKEPRVVAPAPVKKESRPVTTTPSNIGALSFGGTTGYAVTIDKVIAKIEHDHPSVFSKSKITARANRLIPIDIDKISTWGQQTLETNLLNEVVALSTRFSKMDGADTIGDALKATQKSPSVLNKIIRSLDPVSYIPALTVLQQSLTPLRDEGIEYHKKCEQYSKDLMLDLVCLSTTIDLVGTANNTRIEKAVHDRKVLLTNANQQAQLVILKVDQMMGIIEQQNNQVTQLLTITLPAYQLAKA